MSPRAEVEMVGGGEVGLIPDRSLDFELWDAGLAGPCWQSALLLGWSRDVMGSLGSVVVPGRAQALRHINPLPHYEVDIANVAI